MDGCLVIFFETHDQYFLRSSIFSARKHYGHFRPPSQNDCCRIGLTIYNSIAVHWHHADADMICSSFKEPLEITEGLDVVVIGVFIQSLARQHLDLDNSYQFH